MRYWKRVDSQGKTTEVEAYSHTLDIEGAIEITETEFDAFTASLPKPKTLGDEIDDLKARVTKLEKK